MTDSYPFYESLMRRQAESAQYKGKKILKASEIRWEVSPQGRNAPLVDATTGLEAKCFGVVLSELPPGGQSGLHRHTFEAVGYVLEGRGYELMDGERIDWEAGDTFYIPPNVAHRHVNAAPDKPARILQVEAWPLMIALGVAKLEQVESQAGPNEGR